MTEAEFQRLVEGMLAARGIAFHHCGVGFGCTGPKGFPDLLLFVPGRVVAVELKSESGRLSREQLAYSDVLARSGVSWSVWRPSMLGEITVELDGLAGCG